MSNSFGGPIKLGEGIVPEGEAGRTDFDHLSGETDGSYDTIPDASTRDALTNEITTDAKEGQQKAQIIDAGADAVVDQAKSNEVDLDKTDVQTVLTNNIEVSDTTNDVNAKDPDQATENNKKANAVDNAMRQQLIQEKQTGVLKALDYVKTMISNLMKKVVEILNKKWKSEVEETAETKKNDTDDALEKKQSQGKTSPLATELLKILLSWLPYVGFLWFFSWLVAKNQSDCYYIDGAKQTKLDCKGYGDNNVKNLCGCPGQLDGQEDFEHAAETGQGLDTYCGDSSSYSQASSSPICCEASKVDETPYGQCDTYCNAPAIQLQDGLCGSNKYYVYKDITWLDVLGDMADDAAQAANDIFDGFQWSFDHLGLIIVGVVAVIAIIVFLKIISLFGKK